MICPKCGNDMGTSIYCDNCNIYPFKEKEPFQWKKTFKIAGAVIGAIAIFTLVFVGVSNVISENKIKHKYLDNAQCLYDEIISYIEKDDYYDSILEMKNYEERYTADDKYYDSLSKNLKLEEVSKLKKRIIDELSKKSTDLYAKLDANEDITYSVDYDDIVTLEKYLNTLVSNYDYLSENKQNSNISISDFTEKLINCRFTKSLVLYNNGDKYEGITILKDLNERHDLSTEMSEAVDVMLDKMIFNSRATDFEILSGSKEVSVFKSGRNFGWQCPHCGYFTEAAGTLSIESNLSQHYVGEISTYPGMMSCAGKWVGGCGRLSQYTLTIKYK